MNDNTMADIQQAKPSAPQNAAEVSKIHISKNKEGEWEASLEYRDKDGETIKGDTQTFADFSLASAWVAGTEVDVQNNGTVLE